jgi:hypothetical protein
MIFQFFDNTSDTSSKDLPIGLNSGFRWAAAERQNSSAENTSSFFISHPVYFDITLDYRFDVFPSRVVVCVDKARGHVKIVFGTIKAELPCRISAGLMIVGAAKVMIERDRSGEAV